MLKPWRFTSFCIRLILAAYCIAAAYIVLSRTEDILSGWLIACVFYAIGHALCKFLYFLADGQSGK